MEVNTALKSTPSIAPSVAPSVAPCDVRYKTGKREISRARKQQFDVRKQSQEDVGARGQQVKVADVIHDNNNNGGAGGDSPGGSKVRERVTSRQPQQGVKGQHFHRPRGKKTNIYRQYTESRERIFPQVRRSPVRISSSVNRLVGLISFDVKNLK